MIEYLKQVIKIRYKTIKDYSRCRADTFSLSLDAEKKYVFMFLAADYNNLGDIAITITQHKFLNDIFPNFEIVEVRPDETYGAIRAIKGIKPANAIITLIGGGNNGSLYEFLEEPRRAVLRELRKYPIISFPQTVMFEDTNRAKPYYNAFKKVCRRCANLTLTAREKYSFEVYEKILPGHVILTPDIVFSFPLCQNEDHREDWVAFIMRNDKEKIISESFQNKLKKTVRYMDLDLFDMDTCDICITNDREKVFKDYLTRLSKAKFAITDRLHGMILCYITGTPCIVYENNNPKIKSTYETWMRKQSFIFLASENSSGDEAFTVMDNVCKMKDKNIQPLLNCFAPLKKELEKYKDC